MAKHTFPTTFFSLGILIAVVMGAGKTIGATWADNAWPSVVLIVLGLIVGFYSVSEKQALPFLIGVVSLVVLQAVNSLHLLDYLAPRLGTFVTGTLGFVILFIGAAAVVVALKAIFRSAT